MRVAEVSVTRVGSVTSWVKPKEDVTQLRTVVYYSSRSRLKMPLGICMCGHLTFDSVFMRISARVRILRMLVIGSYAVVSLRVSTET